jgi:CHAD domain-containing protein
VLNDTSRNLELEAKLAASPDLDLRDLSGLGPGLSTTELGTRHLDAIYYDTRDLRLARSGITLRYRTGEPGEAWTVKLPEGEEGPALARREITYDGPADRVPDGAADLVKAFTRAAGLKPVARLATTRVPVRIADSSGRPMAEVVDDTVTAWSGRRRLAEFREVEVEVYDHGQTGRRLLDRIVRRLIRAGAVDEPAVPKLLRALGERAAGPPDVSLGPVPAKLTLHDVVCSAIVRSVAQIIRHDPGVRLGDEPEDVHRLRVATRRLRSDLRTFAPLLDQDKVKDVRAELQWLGAQVGNVRDSDVLGARLRDIVAALPEVDSPAGATLMRHHEEQAAGSRRVMLQAMRQRRYIRLLDSLVALAAAPPFVDNPDFAGRGPASAAGLLRRPWKHLSDAVSALADHPSDQELHGVRIRAKRCRYAAEAVAALTKPGAERFAAAMADLQTVLGDHQDTVVAEAWLREAAITDPSAGVAAGQLIAVERTRRTELRRLWPAVWKRASSKKRRDWL